MWAGPNAQRRVDVDRHAQALVTGHLAGDEVDVLDAVDHDDDGAGSGRGRPASSVSAGHVDARIGDEEVVVAVARPPECLTHGVAHEAREAVASEGPLDEGPAAQRLRRDPDRQPRPRAAPGWRRSRRRRRGRRRRAVPGRSAVAAERRAATGGDRRRCCPAPYPASPAPAHRRSAHSDEQQPAWNWALDGRRVGKWALDRRATAAPVTGRVPSSGRCGHVRESGHSTGGVGALRGQPTRSTTERARACRAAFASLSGSGSSSACASRATAYVSSRACARAG